jgi:hypothetical protein
MKHAAGTQSPRLAVGRGDGKRTLQDDTELSCRRRMVETVFEVLSAPACVETSEKRTRGCKVASDVDWRRRRREVRLAEFDRHVLKVRISVGRAIEPCVGEMRRITAVLASRCGGIPRPDYDAENERERLALPAHQSLACKSDGILFEKTLEAVLQHRGPARSCSERKPTIRTRGENRMIGTTHSPRTGLAVL